MEISKQSIVTQSNKLVEAKFALTVQEQRLLLVMISMIHPEDEDFKDYIIHLADLCKLLGLKTQSMYAEAKKITRRLRERELVIQEPTGELQIGWISSAKYLESAGAVRLRFDPALKPYLLALKRQFTRFQLDILIRFKSVHAIRIYQLLKQYETIGKRQCQIADLREMLGIAPDEYTRYNDFKRKVISTAAVQINSNSDISFQFKELKEGKKITSLLFLIKANPATSYPVDSDKSLSAPEDLVALLGQQGITRKDALQAIAVQGVEGVREIFGKVMNDVRRRANAKPILDVSAYLAKCLREGYGKCTEQQRQLKKAQQAQAAARQQQAEQQRLLDEIRQEARAARKAAGTALIAKLTPAELQAHRVAYEQTPDFPGWRAPLVNRLFEVFLKNTLLGPEEQSFREIAKSKEVDYDRLISNLGKMAE